MVPVLVWPLCSDSDLDSLRPECLRPDQRHSLQHILTQAAQTNNVLFVSVSDHFELCLAKCRTSSDSVQHENTYRNKDNKFCFGSKPPPTVGKELLMHCPFQLLKGI